VDEKMNKHNSTAKAKICHLTNAEYFTVV